MSADDPSPSENATHHNPGGPASEGPPRRFAEDGTPQPPLRPGAPRGRAARYPMFQSHEDVQPGMRMIPRGRMGLMLVAVLIVVVVVRTNGDRIRLPDVSGQAIAQAYAAIHDEGMPVTITRSFVAASTGCAITATSTSPAGSSEVTKGSVVTIALGQSTCQTGTATSGSPAAPSGARPAASTSAQRHELVGGSLAAAIAWAGARDQPWSATIPPLREGNAPSLYANDRVIAEQLSGGTLTFTVEVG